MKHLVLCSLALIAAATAAPARMKPVAIAPPTPIPVSVFSQLPSLQDPSISPDGRVLAAKMRAKGEAYLAIIPLNVPNSVPKLIHKDGDFDQLSEVRAAEWFWIDGDNLIIRVVAREDFDGQPYDADRVVGYNHRTGKTTPLGWQGSMISAGTILWRSRAGRPRILLARMPTGKGTERFSKPEVIEVDVTTGEQKIVVRQQPSITAWYADGNGVVRMGTATDRETGKIRIMYRPDERMPFRTILRDKLEKYETPPVPLIFLPGEKAVVISRKSGFDAVYELDLNTMNLGREIYSVKGYDVAAVVPNRERTAIERISVIEDRPRRIWLDQRLKDIQAVLDESFGPGNATVISTDEPRINIVLRVAETNQAGGYYLFNTDTGDFKLVGWANDTLKDMKLNPVKTVRYRASDGKTIAAVLTLPRLRQHKSLPLIVLPHGGPWARDHEAFDVWAQPLAELGYAVIQPNFRGSSGFGKEWEAASDGSWGLRMQDDLNDSIDFLAAQGVADPKRVCIFGWSYGGYAASRAAQRDGGKYRCAISGAGVHDIPDMVAYDKNYLGHYGSTYIGAAATKLADVSPARHARQYSTPILIIHGAKDRRVPVDQSRHLVRRLRAAGKAEGRDFLYIEQPRNTHNLPLEEDRVQVIEEIAKFLARHNPA